jgi:hypothetical protein
MPKQSKKQVAVVASGGDESKMIKDFQKVALPRGTA